MRVMVSKFRLVKSAIGDGNLALLVVASENESL
jgi:hypothetical protein